MRKMIDNKILVGVGVLAFAYIIYKILRTDVDNDFEREMEEILTKEEYKVKGKYD